MTKEVLLSISGLHYGVYEEQDENEQLEVITPAVYYYKNGKHYVFYEEIVEGMAGAINNRVCIDEENGILKITKSGLTSAEMIFEKDKIHVSQYATPYGELVIGTYTKGMTVKAEEAQIDVSISYSLDINNEKAADCEIMMSIKANGKTA